MNKKKFTTLALLGIASTFILTSCVNDSVRPIPSPTSNATPYVDQVEAEKVTEGGIEVVEQQWSNVTSASNPPVVDKKEVYAFLSEGEFTYFNVESKGVDVPAVESWFESLETKGWTELEIPQVDEYIYRVIDDGEANKFYIEVLITPEDSPNESFRGTTMYKVIDKSIPQ